MGKTLFLIVVGVSRALSRLAVGVSQALFLTAVGVGWALFPDGRKHERRYSCVWLPHAVGSVIDPVAAG